ncbi:MAG: ribbon-helix-helix domain-containing protein [Candidatus Methanoplasma sp.]|jgi:Arc/MetJ-type ribon-helix-helix transcriptional regulator|nr:ribbon-helix-helix domain-containing protein [Candidatus Methanoplasma sp.]
MEDGTRVTFRMELDEIREMQDYLISHDIDNRSDFIRDAIKLYIKSERNGMLGAGTAGDGIFVNLTELQRGIIEKLVQDGISTSVEEFARKCVLEKIIPEGLEKEAIGNAFREAYAASRNR